jgi:hypothetical protein
MKHKFNLVLILSGLLIAGCRPEIKQDNGITITPEAGTTYKMGQPVA